MTLTSPAVATREVVADTLTPVAAALRLRERFAFLLESVEGGVRYGRYSILGVTGRRLAYDGGIAVVSGSDGEDRFEAPDPLEALRTILPQPPESQRDLPFPLVPLLNLESVYRPPVEWSGTMPEMDWLATGREIRWKLVEPATGRENMEIDWRFRVGDVVRLRITNDRDVLHAMQHPIHIHGQRFLVLSVNGVPSENLAWKDTFLVPTGATAELLVELSNPGAWMLHCHISEHLETGMMMVFTVEP
jgi:FtsP/CotA-like multicopper oxidase with cupredoxin domain